MCAFARLSSKNALASLAEMVCGIHAHWVTAEAIVRVGMGEEAALVLPHCEESVPNS